MGILDSIMFGQRFNPAPAQGYDPGTLPPELLQALQKKAMGLPAMPTTPLGNNIASQPQAPPQGVAQWNGPQAPQSAMAYAPQNTPQQPPMPMQQPPQMPQQAPQPMQAGMLGGGNKGILGGLQGFLNGPKGDALMGLLSGWAQGGTMQQSLGGGAVGAMGGLKSGKRKQQIDRYLQSAQLDPQMKEFLAGNPDLAEKYVMQVMMPNGDGQTAEIKNWKFAQEHPDFAKMIGNQGGSMFGTPVPFAKPDGSIGYALTSRNGDVVDMQAPGGGKFLGPFDKANMSAEGKSRGDATGDAVAAFNSMTSKMPSLENVVGQLGDLAKTATYTSTGQAVDWFNKEAGLNPRQSAVDRSKYTSLVSNQILPLLRETFGAQFTVREGDTLAATLGDPNKTPAEKQAVLESFIQQKRRDVEALANQVQIGHGGQSPPPPGGANPDPLGIR